MITGVWNCIFLMVLSWLESLWKQTIGIILFLNLLLTIDLCGIHDGRTICSSNYQVTVHEAVKLHKDLLLLRGSFGTWLWSLFQNSLNISIVRGLPWCVGWRCDRAVDIYCVWWRVYTGAKIVICLNCLSVVALYVGHLLSGVSLVVHFVHILNLKISLHF